MAEVPDSILDTTKKLVGVEPEDTDFDLDILTAVNSTFFTLNQLGVGPINGFSIVDNTATWSDYIGIDQIELVKSYMQLKVRMLFDPPGTGPLTEAMERQIEQMEFRLNVHVEGVKWDAAQQMF